MNKDVFLLVIILFFVCVVAIFASNRRGNDSKFNCQITEYNGFMKNVCTDEKRGVTFFKCFSSDIYYGDTAIYFQSRCRDDPYFYQLCGIDSLGEDIEDTEAAALCGKLLCTQDVEDRTLPIGGFSQYEIIKSKRFFDDEIFCNGRYECANTAIDEELCDTDRKYEMLPVAGVIAKNLVCNNECDLRANGNCEDESKCNGVKYGFYCRPKRKKPLQYISPGMICDGRKDCRNGEDERNCTSVDDSVQKCLKYGVEQDEMVVLTDNMRCFPGFAYCYDYIDQTNCTDRKKVAVTCLMNGYPTTVSDQITCAKMPRVICDDYLERQCEQITGQCLVHKHKICDGISDCEDNSDEDHHACFSMMGKKCERRGRLRKKLPIPLSWLTDGLTDCIGGEDEDGSLWPTCGHGPTLRYVTEESKCRDVFLCRGGESGYVEMDLLCDGVESCGIENDVCFVSRIFPNIYTDLQDVIQPLDNGELGWAYHMSYCVRGLSSIERLAKTPCLSRNFKFPDHFVFGLEQVRESFVLPLVPSTCDHVYGENYVFRSCNNACSDSQCPLAVIPTEHSCPTQLLQRVKTYAKGLDQKDKPYLASLLRARGWFTNRIFVCKNNLRCLPYSKVCDLVDDCGDSSDEENCTNHFRCGETSQLIPKTQKCDGVFHCSDISDECNDECSKELLDGSVKKTSAWVFGSSSITFNVFALIRSTLAMTKAKNITSLTNKVLMLLINIGDLMIGIYLLSIAAMDIVYMKNYCFEQIKWLADIRCSVLGVLNTVGSQVSLLSMTLLSVIRAKSVLKRLGNTSPGFQRKNIILLLLQVSLILLCSVAVAVLPIMVSLEDSFVNGLYHDPRSKVFIGFLDKDKHFEVISQYYGRMQKKTLNWKVLIKMVNEMFSMDYGELEKQNLEFYGNDATCMFKYFVTPSDPQRKFVWSILVLNFTCFIIIAFSYFIILSVSKQSTEKLGNRFKKRHKATQRKISAIILTDCVCWIPFIIIAIIHSLKVIDATQWYSVFSIIILPINSVINPFLYDEMLSKTIQLIMQKIFPSSSEDKGIEMNGLECVVDVKQAVAQDDTNQNASRNPEAFNQLSE